MGESIAFLLLIQIVLIALNAVFASAEIAVLTVNEAKLERMATAGPGDCSVSPVSRQNFSPPSRWP